MTSLRAEELFQQSRHEIYRRTDRLFAGLMAFQWIGGIIFALWVSPLAWYGADSQTHIHVWAAVFLGGAICLFPALLGVFRPGEPSTRYTIAVAQMLMGALLIHLTGGRIETHFHVFGSLAFLAFYRDWRVLVPATIVVALDHMLRGFFWPQSVYGVLVASQWRWVEHAAWVVFENVFLVMSCHRGIVEMRQTAERTAALEQEVRTRQQAENVASLTAAVGLALTRGTELKAMLQHCADALVEHLRGGAARIWTFDDRGEVLELQASAGAEGGTQRERDIPLGTGVIGAAARGQKALVTHQAHVDLPAELAEWMQQKGLVAFAVYPLLLDAKLVGTMAIYSPEGFPSSALDAMAAVADGVALGVDRKRAERELERYTRDLEAAHDTQRQNAEQLAALVDELRITQRAAEAATRAKSEFLASMSHELRTPLNAIILYSELLQELAADEGNSSSVGDLQRINGAANHLLQLINGILDLSKIEAGKTALSLENFDVRALIEDLLDTVRPLLEKNGNAFTIRYGEGLGLMRADLMKTRQIVINLLSNAGKFTRAGTIALDVESEILDGQSWIVFRVGDTGVGMTGEESQKIFEPFTQADVTTTRKYGGTGLGLAIVSRFCSVMGGEVSVESEPGQGSVFTVRLPRVVADSVADQVPAVV
jgi:two-component system sensor histidine kinase/response regulator